MKNRPIPGRTRIKRPPGHESISFPWPDEASAVPRQRRVVLSINSGGASGGMIRTGPKDLVVTDEGVAPSRSGSVGSSFASIPLDIGRISVQQTEIKGP